MFFSSTFLISLIFGYIKLCSCKELGYWRQPNRIDFDNVLLVGSSEDGGSPSLIGSPRVCRTNVYFLSNKACLSLKA